MKEIHSLVDGRLLHIIHEKKDFNGRTDFCPPEEFLQCASMKIDKHIFQPHKHIERKQVNEKYITQETFIIIKGRVKCIYYDIDDTIISTHIIGAGDASVTLRGGHNYEILDDNTLLYEIKTGPYLGTEKDRIRL